MRLLNFIIQSKINLAILAALMAIAGILARMLYLQQQAALGAAKEAECRQTELQIPDQNPWPDGNAIPPAKRANLIRVGQANTLYGYAFPDHPRWPGTYFHALTKGMSDRSFLVHIQSIQANAAVVTTPCAPQPISVPLTNLYDILVPSRE